jgi:hypothetical protein
MMRVGFVGGPRNGGGGRMPGTLGGGGTFPGEGEIAWRERLAGESTWEAVVVQGNSVQQNREMKEVRILEVVHRSPCPDCRG